MHLAFHIATSSIFLEASYPNTGSNFSAAIGININIVGQRGEAPDMAVLFLEKRDSVRAALVVIVDDPFAPNDGRVHTCQYS